MGVLWEWCLLRGVCVRMPAWNRVGKVPSPRLGYDFKSSNPSDHSHNPHPETGFRRCIVPFRRTSELRVPRLRGLVELIGCVCRSFGRDEKGELTILQPQKSGHEPNISHVFLQESVLLSLAHFCFAWLSHVHRTYFDGYIPLVE